MRDRSNQIVKRPGIVVPVGDAVFSAALWIITGRRITLRVIVRSAFQNRFKICSAELDPCNRVLVVKCLACVEVIDLKDLYRHDIAVIYVRLVAK